MTLPQLPLSDRDMAFARLNRWLNQRENVSHRTAPADDLPTDDPTDEDEETDHAES